MTVIESRGSTSLVQVGSNYFFYPVGGSSGPELMLNGAPVTVGEFGGWTPIGAEKTTSGYDVAWNVPGTDQYIVWRTDSNGNFVDIITAGVVSGTSVILEELEGTLNQDLNQDG